jgi:hypothetical protein
MSTAVCAATPVSAARRVSRGLRARSPRAPFALVAHRERPRASRGRPQGRWECFARGGRADEQPFDPNGLSPAERAAMRNEWSLECRQVGLDHLADCFAKPAAVNPADADETRVGDDETMNSSSSTGATSPKERDDVSPMRLLIKNVKGTSCEPAKLRYLNGEGAFGVKHTGNGAFDAHLIGVRRVMQAWCPQKPHLHDAGLFHSIYGSEGFQGFCLPFEKRDELRSMIGEKAENLVYIFCVVDRLTVDNDLDSPPGSHAFRARPELGGFPIPVDDETWFDFVALTLGDWLEQVEGAARSPNEKFEWRVGDAWGYRRGAYKRMAEIVGEKIPIAKKMYRETYAREGDETKSVRQPVTPPMSDAIREGRKGLPHVEPKYP